MAIQSVNCNVRVLFKREDVALREGSCRHRAGCGGRKVMLVVGCRCWMGAAIIRVK